MASQQRSAAGVRVLCVDDDGATLYLVRRALELDGFEVATAGGVSEGLAALGRGRFQLVISDYRLPDGTGTEMLREAGRAGLLEGAEVLLYTSSSQVEGAGALEVVTKGPDAAALVARAHRVLGTRARRPQETAMPPPSPPAPPHVELVLYVAGRSPASLRAQRNLQRALAPYQARGQVEVQVVDLAEGRPASAADDHVLLTPTLVRHAPLPRTWLVGDLEDAAVLTDLLHLSGLDPLP